MIGLCLKAKLFLILFIWIQFTLFFCLLLFSLLLLLWSENLSHFWNLTAKYKLKIVRSQSPEEGERRVVTSENSSRRWLSGSPGTHPAFPLCSPGVRTVRCPGRRSAFCPPPLGTHFLNPISPPRVSLVIAVSSTKLSRQPIFQLPHALSEITAQAVCDANKENAEEQVAGRNRSADWQILARKWNILPEMRAYEVERECSIADASTKSEKKRRSSICYESRVIRALWILLWKKKPNIINPHLVNLVLSSRPYR